MAQEGLGPLKKIAFLEVQGETSFVQLGEHSSLEVLQMLLFRMRIDYYIINIKKAELSLHISQNCLNTVASSRDSSIT